MQDLSPAGSDGLYGHDRQCPYATAQSLISGKWAVRGGEGSLINR